LYGRQQVEEFADHLFAEADYGRAWLEYRRAAFTGPGSDSLSYKAGVALRLSGDGLRAARWFAGRRLGCGEGRLHRASLYQQCYAWLQAGHADSAGSAAGRGCPATTSLREHDAAYLSAGSRLVDTDWSGARERLAAIEAGSADPRMVLSATRLDSIALAAIAHPRKSILTARLLSLVVPGLGRLYTGRPLDAFSSFVSVAGMGWMAYRAFERDGEESLAGWAYSAVSLGFYAGEIYGAGRSASVRNDRIDDGYRSQGLRVFLSYHPDGIGLRGEFALPATTD
jgi:hypothetical protein